MESLLAQSEQVELFDPDQLPVGRELLLPVAEQRHQFTAERVALNQAKYQAIVGALGEGLGVRTICRAFHVSHHTVFTIRDRESALVATVKEEMSRRCLNIAKMAAERFEEAVANNEISPGQLPVAVGILVDKSLLLAGEVTHRIEVRSGLDQDAVRKAFEALSRPIEVQAEIVVNSELDSVSSGDRLSDKELG